jgi:hypothetical protein
MPCGADDAGNCLPAFLASMPASDRTRVADDHGRVCPTVQREPEDRLSGGGMCPVMETSKPRGQSSGIIAAEGATAACDCLAACVDGARLSGAHRLRVQTGQSRAKRKRQVRIIVKIEFGEIAGCNHGRALTIAMAKGD